jgi:hypothetical protein
MTDPPDPPLPPIRRTRPAPKPGEERFVPKLAAPPLAFPRPAPADPYAARRARAERLCLWLACSRVLCRRARRCVAPRAPCVFDLPQVTRPILR